MPLSFRVVLRKTARVLLHAFQIRSDERATRLMVEEIEHAFGRKFDYLVSDPVGATQVCLVSTDL